MEQAMIDRRKEFTYRGVRVTPEPPRGLLRRHWRIHWWRAMLVDCKADVRTVLDALDSTLPG